MKTIVIYGIDHVYAAEMVESLHRLEWDVVAGVVTGEPKWSLTSIKCVIQPEEVTPELAAHPVVVSQLTPGNRLSWIDRADEAGFSHFETVIDPTAILASSVVLGRGIYVNAGAVVGTFVQLDDHVFVNRSASVGHHTRIEEFGTVGPQATIASNCYVGRGAFIGAGATVAPSVIIGANSVVGAGAVVIEDVADNTTVVGNPARVIKRDIEGYGGVSVPAPA